MRDSRLTCACCGKRESSSGCVRGRPNCCCDTEFKSVIYTVSLCPDCVKCPTHCKCDLKRCHCATKFFGHKTDCDVRLICKAKIQRANALDKLDSANRRLKEFGIEYEK